MLFLSLLFETAADCIIFFQIGEIVSVVSDLFRDLRIVFFRIESAVRFVFESNLRIESAVYHASRNCNTA